MLYSGTVLGDGKEYRLLFLTADRVERVKKKYAQKGARFVVDGDPTPSDQKPVFTKRKVVGRAARTATEMLTDVKQRARNQGRGGLRESRCTAVVNVTRKTYHDTIADGAEAYSVQRANLSAHLLGQSRTIGGMVFRYATPEETAVRRCLSTPLD